jgi:hypothetical protein
MNEIIALQKYENEAQLAIHFLSPKLIQDPYSTNMSRYLNL